MNLSTKLMIIESLLLLIFYLKCLQHITIHCKRYIDTFVISTMYKLYIYLIVAHLQHMYLHPPYVIFLATTKYNIDCFIVKLWYKYQINRTGLTNLDEITIWINTEATC